MNQNINIDGNLESLRRYEREQDMLDQKSARIEALEEQICQDRELLFDACDAAGMVGSIEDAITAYARRLEEEAHE